MSTAFSSAPPTRNPPGVRLGPDGSPDGSGPPNGAGPPGSGPSPGSEPPRSGPPPDAGREDAEERVRYYGDPKPRRLPRPRKAWRESVLIRADELGGLISWMSTRADYVPACGGGAAAADLDAAAHLHLSAARTAATDTAGRRWGARMERAVGNLDAAEALVLRRSPDDYLRGELSALVAHVQAHLPPTHPERVWVQNFVGMHLAPDGKPAAVDRTPIADDDRAALVEARRTASWAERREHARLRSFRTVVVLTTVALALIAIGLGILGARAPRLIPLCFAPQGSATVVCPTATAAAGTLTKPLPAALAARVLRDTATGRDVPIVMIVGMVAAAVTGAAAIRRMRGTSTPFAIPLLLLVLKLPTGALTALLGLLLLHGQFVPGLSALDDSGQILAWAVLFGAAQQLVTGLVDKKAQSVLDSTGSAPMEAPQE